MSTKGKDGDELGGKTACITLTMECCRAGQVMGIGCDDAFVVSDTWAQAGVLYPREADRLAWTLKNSLPTILGSSTVCSVRRAPGGGRR